MCGVREMNLWCHARESGDAGFDVVDGFSRYLLQYCGTATVHKLPEKTFVILFLLAGGPGVEEQSKYYIGTYYLLDSHTYLKL